MKNEKWKKSSQLPIFKRCLTLLTILIVRTSKQRFCSLFPALAKRRPFRRERIEKSDGTFDFARNGFQHTLVGWFRITEDFMKGKKDTKSKSKTYYLFRFKCYPNLNENVDPVYKHLMKMSYTHFKKGGDSRVDFYIANGKKKLKKIVSHFEMIFVQKCSKRQQSTLNFSSSPPFYLFFAILNSF